MNPSQNEHWIPIDCSFTALNSEMWRYSQNGAWVQKIEVFVLRQEWHPTLFREYHESQNVPIYYWFFVWLNIKRVTHLFQNETCNYSTSYACSAIFNPRFCFVSVRRGPHMHCSQMPAYSKEGTTHKIKWKKRKRKSKRKAQWRWR